MCSFYIEFKVCWENILLDVLGGGVGSLVIVI